MEQHFLAVLAGFFGGMIPNDKSNIHPLLMGAILSILLTKIFYGDYDKGYQWTLKDFYFVLIVGGEGALGAYFAQKMKH
jgi:hypothetical protein